MVQVLQQVAIEERLALLAEPEHRVQLGARPRRGHVAQEVDVAGRHLHVDHEIRARQREEDVDLLRVEHDRVQRQPAGVVAKHRHDEGPLLVAVDDLAEHVGGLVPVEGRAEDLNLVVPLEMCPHSARVLVEVAHEEVEIAVEIGERPAPAEVEEDGLEACAQAPVVRVVAAVDRRIGFDVLGRDCGAHEDQVVVGIGTAEDPRDHGVEERLGELGLRVVDEQADVQELRVLPDADAEGFDVELGPQARHALEHPLVVEADPFLHRPLRVGPGCCLEMLLRAGAGRPEEAVVLVEALDQHPGDLSSRIGGGRCGGNRADMCGGGDSLSGLSRRLPFPHEHTVGE